uniref:Uncharacterized protein n=1 Tax=viral metagenome TaxID=1070528 RepID=A0A6C0IZC4_9ZZZZ
MSYVPGSVDLPDEILIRMILGESSNTNNYM